MAGDHRQNTRQIKNSEKNVLIAYFHSSFCHTCPLSSLSILKKYIHFNEHYEDGYYSHQINVHELKCNVNKQKLNVKNNTLSIYI